MRVLFATAELRPLVSAGGLGEAASGLLRELRSQGVDVEAVVPDYGGWELADEQPVEDLWVPGWAAPARARRGTMPDIGPITLVDAPGIAKPHPYVDGDGRGWPDNDLRFAAFSAAIAAICDRTQPDILHLNDWHTAMALGLISQPPPSILTIHTLAYQGQTHPGWLDRLPHWPHRYAWWGGTNPLAGAIALATRVVAVSPNYAREIQTPAFGAGLDGLLRARADALVGIRNGIDVAAWNPSTDTHLAATYTARSRAGKAMCRDALHGELGWLPDADRPVVVMVTRLVDQKGVDLVLDLAHLLPGIGARLALLGSGDRAVADRATATAAALRDSFAFVEGYDAALSHRLFGGGDLLLMPSRFEPCGLAQMQAMAYGTIPVVTDVGGLHDTVVDADADPGAGIGFVAASVDTTGLVDALHRAVRAWRVKGRRRDITTRGMTTDWSWAEPAQDFIALYETARR